MTWPWHPDWIDEAIKKYRRKTDHVRLTPLLRKAQEWTNYRRAAAQGRLESTTLRVKNVLDVLGVYSDFHHQYLAYALALEKTQRDMRFMVDLIREHRILRNRFENRALEASVLDSIDALIIYRTADY